MPAQLLYSAIFLVFYSLWLFKEAITLLYFSWTTRLFFYEQDGQLLVCVRGCVESYALSINFSKCSNLFCEFVVNTQRRQ